MSLLWKSATKSTARVPMEDLPVHPEPYGISTDDVPAEYAKSSDHFRQHFEGTYTLHHMDPHELAGHHCTADCWSGEGDPYTGTTENGLHSRDMEDDFPGQEYEKNYVNAMARDVHSLPALVGTRREDGGVNWFGGQHRIAAHGTTGTKVPIWIKDEDR